MMSISRGGEIALVAYEQFIQKEVGLGQKTGLVVVNEVLPPREVLIGSSTLEEVKEPRDLEFQDSFQ